MATKKKARKGKGNVKRLVKARKGVRRKRAIKAVKGPKEKVLGKIDHYFDKISVAALKVTAPIKVGDVIHIKGHTTDFVQKIDSLQIEHASVLKAGKGLDVGIKVKERVRAGDKVYLAAEQQIKHTIIQSTMFPAIIQKPTVPAITKPSIAAPAPQLPKTEVKKKTDPYLNTKFLKF